MISDWVVNVIARAPIHLTLAADQRVHLSTVFIYTDFRDGFAAVRTLEIFENVALMFLHFCFLKI